MDFQALPSRIGQVRRIVAAQLHHWELDPLVDTATLGVTELLANVHRHTGEDKHCLVELVLLWDRLTVSVRDHDPRLPQLRTATTFASSGRGLALVEALSVSWGARVQRGGAGKVVWFTLPAPVAAGQQARADLTARAAGATSQGAAREELTPPEAEITSRSLTGVRVDWPAPGGHVTPAPDGHVTE